MVICGFEHQEKNIIIQTTIDKNLKRKYMEKFQ